MIHTRKSLSFAALLCSLVNAACGDSSGPDGTSNDGAVANNEDDSCDLESVLREETSDAPEVVDCGTLELDPAPSDTAYAEAQQCVLDAIDQDRAFRLVHERRGIDSRVATAYAWAGGDAAMRILSFDGDPSGGSSVGTRIDAQSCSELVAKRECEPSSGDLCLGCVDGTEPSIRCDESR